jgi:hypothetical protein
MLFSAWTTITDSTVADNSALASGGGVFVDLGGALTVDRSNLYRNVASGAASARGGGLYVGTNPAAPLITGTVQNSLLAHNTGFEVSEDSCTVIYPYQFPILSYFNNTITAASGGDVYRTGCGPIGDITAGELNQQSGGKASGNVSSTPVFASFAATPSAGPSVLAWSVARATSVSITGVGAVASPTGTVDVSNPGCPVTYALTANTYPGSPALTVACPPPADTLPGPAPTPMLESTFTAPTSGAVLVRGTMVAFMWTAVPGATQYGFEYTGPGRQFANPNAATVDPVNGYGGAGGGLLVTGTTLSGLLPLDMPPGTYQVRVIGLSASFQVIGTFSDAVTITIQ